MIRLEKVKKVYDDGFQALKDINLEFKEGEINVLIGPSGCGKTTTMKLLNRLNEPTDGTVYINEKDISQMDPVELRRQTGYVIQHIGLFPHMSIAENVGAVPTLLKWDKDKIDKRVDELLNLVNLDPETYKTRFPSELSGGQQQRIGVIRALAAEPPVILMDEPFSALDPISREQLQDELLRLQKEINKTFVFVTHDIDEALKIADQIILMQGGEVVQKGKPSEVLSNPENDFVVDFIGKHRLEENRNSIPNVDEVMMEKPLTISSSESLTNAYESMKQHGVNSLVVVDRGELKGQVSIFDVIDVGVYENKLVKEVLKPFEQVVEIGTSLKVVLDLMEKNNAANIPVMNNNQFAGMVTRGSVVELLASVYANSQREGA
ncbi:ABC transporter ATP-binding protein [Pontibacillus marinus]|uniref:Quaternary amine transport ATP-binding protein n=1 Tax=Pontibacillus marinus BH030004 = DSM 16465 TaxID=1385511 RepID=A0A0A5GHS3_9BACI|nr:ABC transporter ATP-binding protein [Pontibacillus marinus]KGX90778.1 glycine/betaine ABC transporter ATPase [Pontibacillus marinus BH030004 = DSM 16465]